MSPPSGQSTTGTYSFREVAIRVADADNVCVVKRELHKGDTVHLEDGREFELRGGVTPGNRFALRAIPEGEFVLQYAQPIGTSLGIEAGEPVSLANMSNDVPVVRQLPDDLANPAPDYIAADERGSFPGYRRPDGRVGTRNLVLIVPTSMCSSHEAMQIATIAEFNLYSREKFPNVDGVVAIPHNKGCGCSDGSNLDVMMRTLANCADHPNAAAVIFIDLGCEKTNLDLMSRYLKRRGGLSWDKPTAWLGIQDLGGTQAAVQEGLKEVERLLPLANASERGGVFDGRPRAWGQVRRVGRLFWTVRQPGARTRCRPTRAKRRHGPDHRGTRVLRRRACLRTPRAQRRSGSRGLSDR